MYEDIFITVDNPDDINVTNISKEEVSPYKCYDSTTGESFLRANQINKGVPQCEHCFIEFKTYSQLCSHQGKPCYQENLKSGIPIDIRFHTNQLPYIEDVLKTLNFEIKELDNNMKQITVDKNHFEITMRRLYFAQITKYNLEQWYEPLEKLSTEHNQRK